MTEQEVLVLLEDKIARAGGTRAFAAQIAMHPSYLSRIIGRSKPLHARVLEVLGIERCPTEYRITRKGRAA